MVFILTHSGCDQQVDQSFCSTMLEMCHRIKSGFIHRVLE